MTKINPSIMMMDRMTKGIPKSYEEEETLLIGEDPFLLIASMHKASVDFRDLI